MTRHVLELLSFLFLLVGIAFSIWGTFLLTHLYHAFRFPAFLEAVRRATWLIASFRFKTLVTEAKVAAGQGEVDPENRAKALIGLYLLFLGFVMQGIGTLLGLADVYVAMAEKDSGPATSALLHLFK